MLEREFYFCTWTFWASLLIAECVSNMCIWKYANCVWCIFINEEACITLAIYIYSGGKPNILEIFTIKFDLESQDRWLSKTDLNWEVSHPLPKCGDPSLDGWLVITQTGSWMIQTQAPENAASSILKTHTILLRKNAGEVEKYDHNIYKQWRLTRNRATHANGARQVMLRSVSTSDADPNAE